MQAERGRKEGSREEMNARRGRNDGGKDNLYMEVTEGIRFSIIVVCLNPGAKLNQTLDSILKQTCRDYEIVVKDGGSRDGSVEGMRRTEHIRLFSEKDSGIYEAMNQAVSHARGDYILFLNCGDIFYDERVLERTAAAMEERNGRRGADTEYRPCVFYGDTYSEKNAALIASPPKITGFTCYRNIPCHQSCFYAAELCRRKPYDPDYRIRADYDHFLWCFYVAKAEMIRMDQTVSSYEGGGYSESKENRRRDRKEHKQITCTYMGKGELFWFRFIMLCTLAPLRKALAESRFFSGIYHRIKILFYH